VKRKIMVLLGSKKMLWTLVVLLGVLLPLFVASYRLPVEDVTGRTERMLTYSSDGEGFKFSYPRSWLLRTEKNYSGGEIVEHVSFADADQTGHGFIQVMVLKKPIPDYIQESEKTMVPGYDSLELKQTAVGDKQGYVLSYKRGTGAARTVATEYFFQKGDKVYRFSYFYPESQAEQYSRVFEEMVRGFILPDKSPGPE